MGVRFRSFATLLGLLTAVSVALGAQTPSVTVGGVGYVQYQYQLNKDTVLNGHQNNFDVTRAYVNAIGKFPKGLTTRITLDLAGRSANTSYLAIRIKYAYLAWTPEDSHLTYKLGAIHTPWLDWEEALWDYRMQGQMALERGGYVSSSDFGAGVDGNWGYEKFNAQVGVYNGENYSGAPGDQRKDLMARASYKLMNTDLPGKVGGLRLTGYAQYGKPTGGGKRQRYLGMLSHKSKQITLAAEYAMTRDSVAASTSVAKGRVLSAFGVYNVPNSAIAILARVDITDPNTASAATNDRLTRIIGGASYQVTPNFRLLVDLDHVSRQGGNEPNGFKATSSTAYVQGQFTY